MGNIKLKETRGEKGKAKMAIHEGEVITGGNAPFKLVDSRQKPKRRKNQIINAYRTD